jgi:hypothetical protein
MMMINRLGSLLFLLKAILGLMFFVLILAKLATPIASNDIWWHMALGRMHLSTGSLTIDHSVFTWSPATAYHAYNSWLSDIVFYITYETAGVLGLQLIKFAVFILVFILILHFAIKRGVANKLVTWLIAIIGFGLFLPTFMVKPELFSLLFMVIVVWLYYHLRAAGDRVWWQAYLFPVLVILWVNIHGAFFLSALFFAATIIGELLNAKFNPDQAMAGRLQKHYLIAMLLCVPAILINPYGIDLPLMILELVFGEGVQNYSQISAYQPTYAFNEAPYFLLDYMILSMGIFILLLWQKMKLRKTDWVVIISYLTYCFLFVQIARTTYFLTPVFIFAALDMLSAREKSIFWSDKIIKKVIILSGSVLVMYALLMRVAINTMGVFSDPVGAFNRIQIVAHEYPQAEVGYIESNLSGDKIGNIYKDGGYLIFRLWPERKILIDPRYFPFKSWIEDYFKFTRVGEDVDMEVFLDSMKADFWLINYNKINLFEWFSRSNDWGLEFFGPVGAVFVPIDEFTGSTLFSNEIGNVDSAAQLAIIVSAALVLDKPDLVREIRNIANSNIDGFFSNKNRFIDEIDSIIHAMDLCNSMEYEKAAKLYANTQYVPYAKMQGAKLYRYLASNAWDEGDYFQARKWSIAAHLVMREKSILDVYNIVLTDWHTRNELGDIELLNDGVEWYNFADLLISNSNLTKNEEIVSIVKSMINGTYTGDAELFQKSVFLENELSQQKRANKSG